MANLFQAWDEDIQALGAAKASDDQIEARRQQLAEHFKAKAKAAGLSSKKIYETLDQFDAYSRQKTTAQDNQLTPEEQEMAQRVKDGTVTKGAIKEVGKRFKDVGLGVVSSLTRMGGDVAQTWADVGDNDKSELSSQIAQGLYNATDDIRSNYSEGTKQAKKDFWSPAGLTMGVSENLGQIAGSATVFGAAGKLAAARGLSKAATLATMGTVGAPLAYSQGYGQGKENSLDEINKTSNAQLWENVKAELKAYDDAGGTGEEPYLVSMFKEAGGDLNLMKDLMAENAGNRSGIMTVATEPLAMGVGSLMSRGAAAGGTGVMAKFANAMNNQGMSNELARRVAAGGKLAIASQAGKIAATQMGREGVQETAQEGLEGYYAKGEGSRAAGRKGELTSEDWSSSDGNGIIQQGLQGGAIGLLMGAGGAGATLRNASKLALEKNGLPEKHEAAIIAHEQAIANLAKATEILDLNPEDVKAQEVHAKAYDEALVATNNLEQLTGKFNALYTPEEQAVIKAKTMEGVAARAKVAEDAAKAQKELDDAQAKAAQEQQAQQAEILKAQRENTVNKLASMVGDEVALNEELARLNLGADEENALVTEAYKVAKKQKKAEKQAQNQAQAKTPLDSALDMLFDAKGNRNNKDAQDAADTHKIQLVDLVPAIAQRIESNKQQQTQAERQNKKAEYEKTKVREAEQAANKEKLTDKQQLENTLADFAANNDHDSMVNFLRDYDPKEADTLIANAYKTVANRTKAEQDAITASQKAEALKVKESEAKTQAEQKKVAFNQDMADLHATNPDATMADLNVIGKKHGVKSPIELAKAWVKAKNEAKAAKEAAPKLALPSPETATKDERDVSVPTGLNINRDNIENQDRRPIIVRNDGKPFPTQAQAEKALEVKSKKPRRRKEKPITKDTHEVIPVDGGFAIAPVVEIQQPKKPDDNEDGGVIADAPKPNAPVSPAGEQVADNAPTQAIEGEYRHSRIESAKATVTKTDKGYDVDWGDEVQSFTGKNAAEKTQAALKKEGFSKKNPDNDNGGVPVEPVAPKPVSPTGGNSTPQTTPKTDAEQIRTIGSKEDGLIASKFREDLKSFLTKIDEIDGYENEPSDLHKFSTFLTNEILQKRAENQDDLKGFISKSLDLALDGSNYIGLEGVFNDRSRINAVEEFLYKKAKSTESLSFENKEKDYSKSTGQQISEAMDKTATAITEAAHNKVVERVRKGEEIVYKKPDAIERAKQDDRYQVEINDKGHAVVKNVKDSSGEWVKQDNPVTAESSHIDNGKIEEVTGEVIRESLAKVNDKPIGGKTIDLKEAKQWLLDSIDKAIAVAPKTLSKAGKDAIELVNDLEGKIRTKSITRSEEDKKGIQDARNLLKDLYITFDVPNDGVFKVLNKVESLQKFKKKVEANRGFDKQSPKKVFPSVAQNSADTTIAEFLGDGEVENAYEFAKLQDKPIRFGAGQLNGKPIALAYALAESVDLGSGFKGFVGLSLDKKTDKKEWMFIEENSRLSIGFGSLTKQGVIKEAKERLAQLSSEQKANLLKNSPKLEKTDAELEQQWLSQIGYNPNQNEDEVKTDVKAKAEDKQNKAIGDEILNQEPEKVTTKAVDDLKQNIERVKEADSNAQAKEETQPITSEPVSSVSKMQNAKAEMYLDSKTSSEYGETSIKELIDNRIRDGWTLVSGWKEDKAAGKKLDDELAYLRRNAPIGNKNHPETQRLKELTELTKGDTYRDGNFLIKEETNRLESPSGKLMALNKTAYEYAKTKAVQSVKPTPVTQPESKPTPIASTSSSDLSDEEYIALKKAYNDFKAKTDKINATYSRDVALEIATGLVAEMPDKEDKIRQALIDAIRENQWNRFEINFPKQPIKVETDVELNRALKRLQKALEGTDYTVNGTFNEKSAKLLFSYKSGANGSRESVLIDRVNGKFTSYHVDFDNMSREFLKPLMDATVKWLNGEEISKMKLGDDSQWDYTTLLSTPRHIDNAFNEAKANAPTVSKSDKLAQSYDEAKTKTMEQRQSESRAEKMAEHKKRIDALPIGVRRALSYDIYKEIAESKGDYVDGTYPVNLKPNDIGDMTAYYKEKANKEPRNKGVTVGYGDSKDYALDRKALRELADNGLYSDSYLGDNKAEPKEKQQQNPAKEEAQKQETNSKTPTLDKHNALMDSVRDGKATAEDFKQSFADVFANKDAILLELNALTKDQLLKEGGYAVQYRHKNDKKSEVAEAVYHSMIAEYALGRGITYGMGKNSYENAVQKMVESTDQQRLDEFAQEYKQMIDGRISDLKAKAEALENPQTLDDFRMLMRKIMADGKSRQEAFLTLSAEHRIKYDELEAESTKEARETRKRAAQANINTASQTTDGKIIETKHTRDGYDLFVVQLSDRLSTDDYKKVLSEAKKLGGWYSSYKGGGAIVGFQFKDKEAAQAFLALAGGDTTAAKEQLSQKQDDYADNRSQSAAERLLDMAEKIEAKANEELDRDRKANTARRARFAMSAENEARAKIALAKTMRNIAEAIKNGKAKFLDNIRMKVDVEALRAYITTAKDNEIRSEYDSYAEQVKRKGQPATAATADFATYPTYTLFRSDLAFLGRQLLEIDGLKKLGQQIMMVADDVSDAYLEFAKKNLYKVSRFQTKDSALATFSSKETAERAIKKSGLTGKAIVLQVKRGENIVILSPSEAINLKVWEGDADKRITLKREFGNQLVESVGRRAGKNNRLLPYQFQYAYDKLKALSRIGIETPSEFRSALREFIALQEQVVNNKVREMELAMVGRKNDGLDFFPTSPAVVAEMLDAAEIQPGMRVLEPSAGMGHIADQIREQAEIDPDVVEFSPERRELLKAKGHNVIGNDFLEVSRKDALPVSRSELVDIEQFRDAVRGDVLASVRSALYWFDRGDYEGAASLMDRATRQAEFNEPAKQKFGNIIERLQAAAEGQYDRIIMNPPFSNRQDAEHVRHAYDLLRPNGRIVAIMGEGVFFGSDKKAVEFREWLESVGGTSEKLPDNSFMDSSLPVNTGVNARMVIIDKQDSDSQANEDKPKFSRGEGEGLTTTQTRAILVKYFGEKVIKALESSGLLTIMATPPSWAEPDADGAYDKDSGKAYLFTDNLSAETVVATLAHELAGHKGFQEMMTPTAYASLMRQFNRLVNQGNAIALAAKARAEAAESTDGAQQDEMLPYLLTQQATLNATRTQQMSVKKLIEQAKRAVKAWLFNLLSKYGFDAKAARLSESFTPEDMIVLAERMIREMGNGTKPSNNTKAKGSQFSQLNTPQTQINAVRKKYEGTSQWMKAPNGQPTKLNEVQWLQVRTPNFKAWFGDWENDPANASKVVDENGEPLVVYHSTKTDSSILYAGGVKEKGTPLKGTRGADMAGVIGIDSGAGIWFSDSSNTAENNSGTGLRKSGAHNVIPAFLNLKNPLPISSHQRRNELKELIPISKLSYPVVPTTIYDEKLKRNVKQTKYYLDFPYRFDWQQKDIIKANGFDGIYMQIPSEDTEIIAFDPTQIKSAIGNNGEFNPTNPDIRFSRTEQKSRSSSLDNFISKAIAEKEWLTTEQINLLNSATTFDELKPLLDKVWNQYFESIKLKNINSTKTAVGVDNIKSLIQSEVDSGNISKEHGDLALYFAEKNPALFDSLKSFSFQNNAETLSGNAVGGVYNVVDKVVRISRRTEGSQLTIAHEVLHHAEEFLPENIKSSIIKAWQNDLIRAFKSAENGSNRKTMLHAIIHSIAMGDTSVLDKAIDSMDGVIPANTYHLFNPSEYWAENASRLMNNRSKKQDTWIENARSWVNGLIQTLKNALGLQNDAAILKGLRMVLSGSQLKEGGKGIDTNHVYNMKMLNLFSYIGKFDTVSENKTIANNEKYSRQSKNPITEGIKSAANDAKNSLPTPIAKSIDNFMAGRRLPSSDMANITAKTELSLYHRTIGTQQNTALQNADFKKVYDIAQRYLQHVAVDAYAALKVAPNLLGKLESWDDFKKDIKKIWPATFIKQKADRAAVASIIFDETLSNKLLSDADILKALTREQRKIYKEARDAIQVSLENTAKSEMVRKLLAAEAINWSTVESLINQDLPVEQFAQTVRDMVESRIGGFKNELEAILDADPKIKEAFKTGNKNKLIPAQKKELKKALTLKAQIETTEEALKSLNDVEARLETLIEQGYAPLMRFGEYTLTVRDLDGKVKSFFMFESKSEQVRAVNTIVARYGKTVNLETDMISKEEFKQFAGMTPETMALFAKETGMDKDEAYQHYLKLAIPARSAMTRMIKRKGTEGFSDDIQRVVASFVMSNARMSAKNIYAAQIEKSIQDIESGKSVKDQAIVMKENVFNPKENSAQLRNFLFLWNLGGSIFFGLLNMTQPYMQTLPHLSQYVPIGDATRAILRGSKIAGSAMKNGTAPKGYEAEYNRAVREGVVDPQNVFMLSGVERGKTGASNSAWGVITHTMGLIAQVTESFNRKAVFIASLQVAKQKGDVWLKKKGFNSAYDFAKDSVDQTQGVYDKANRSNWANTSVGAPLMVFKQFSINYVEQMVRMWKKEAASGDEGKKAVFLMLAMLASLSGMMGLPFIKDILDVSETTAAFLGNPVNIEREARLALGKDLADPLFNGVLNHFVFNNLGMDIQSRTGMPDLVPWSNALNPTLSAQGRINEFASIAGATGGLIEKGYDATQLIARDEYGAAAKTLAPRFLTSWIDGSKMALTNEVMDRKGNKLFDTTWDEGLVKFIDANPKRMADLSRTKSLEWKDKAIQDYMTTNFKQKIIAAMMDNDQAEVQNLMKKVQEWNTSRPKYPVFINLNTLSKNANKKDQTFDARESIPKGMDWMKNERPEM